MTTWFVVNEEGECWSHERGWIPCVDTDVTTFDDDEKEEFGTPKGGEWVEGASCDVCGELMPERGGELRTAYISVPGAGPVAVEYEWACAECVAQATYYREK
jgi:hypothetical protein